MICYSFLILRTEYSLKRPEYRPKIRPKNGFFCYVPFLSLIFWVTFCTNRNTLTFDSNHYKKTNLSGVKIIVIVSPLSLVDAHTKICPKY